MKPKFHFSNQYSDFARRLGELCPDRYSHEPDTGDTVNISMEFLGIRLKHPVVTRRIAESKRLRLIYEKLDGYNGLDEEDLEYLDTAFDYREQDPGSYSKAVAAKFSQEISESFLKKHFNETSNFSPGKEITDGRMKCKVTGDARNGYVLSGHLRLFIDGNSVISTKPIDEFKSAHAKSSEIENVAWSDRILPPALINGINSSLDEICRNEPADYHPGSGKVVRDIVHPSMYCYVKGVSPVDWHSASPIAPGSQNETRTREDKDFWGRDYEDSVYQWLPAEFFVSEDGKAQIKTYINNLDRIKYPGIYEQLERMFEKTLPMFEAVCGSLRNDFYGIEGNDLGKKSISLRNRTLQVVTKIVEYRVNHEENFDGVWHVEGMSHEEILATALCVIKRDRNFSGAEIEFRRFLFADEGDALISSTPQNANRPTDTMGGGDVRPLGRLKTPANRVIVFPNSHIHRLSSMRSSDGEDAVRRIVVFWLVNPDRPIISSANVAEQQKTMSLDEALRHRLALMAERKLHKESFEEREVFLCEH